MIRYNHKKDIDSLVAHMYQNALKPAIPIELHIDNELHEYAVSGDKPDTKNGWYVVITYLGNIAAVVYGTCKYSGGYHWLSDSRKEIPLHERVLILPEITQVMIKAERRRTEMKANYLDSKIWDCTCSKEDYIQETL
jgi:hypothetical protein